MSKFEKVAAQGEITILRVVTATTGKTQDGYKPLALENGMYVIGHSETGHHHVLEHTRGVSLVVAEKALEGMHILHAILTEPNALVHKRPFDTHEPLALAPGEYEFRIAREYDPYAELARRSED